jgi:hypothetical protein
MLCGTRLKSARAPRSRKKSQSPLRSQICNPRTDGRLSPGITATSEAAGTAERHGFCEMPFEAFARLPQGHDKGLKCGGAHLNRRERASPLVRPDRGKACFPALGTFVPRLRSTSEWSSKSPERRRNVVKRLNQAQHTTARRSGDIVLWGNQSLSAGHATVTEPVDG